MHSARSEARQLQLRDPDLLLVDGPKAKSVVDGDHRDVGDGVRGVDRGRVGGAPLECPQVGDLERKTEAMTAVLRADQGVVLIEPVAVLGFAGQFGVAREGSVGGDGDRRTGEVARRTPTCLERVEAFGCPALGLELQVVEEDLVVDETEQFAVLVDVRVGAAVRPGCQWCGRRARLAAGSAICSRKGWAG
jgi:hypothetical protein